MSARERICAVIVKPDWESNKTTWRSTTIRIHDVFRGRYCLPLTPRVLVHFKNGGDFESETLSVLVFPWGPFLVSRFLFYLIQPERVCKVFRTRYIWLCLFCVARNNVKLMTDRIWRIQCRAWNVQLLVRYLCAAGVKGKSLHWRNN